MPAPDFSHHIEKLLRLAGITNTPDTRRALDWYLQTAQLGDIRAIRRARDQPQWRQ